jgi:hypothetical protein
MGGRRSVVVALDAHRDQAYDSGASSRGAPRRRQMARPSRIVTVAVIGLIATACGSTTQSPAPSAGSAAPSLTSSVRRCSIRAST